jgi:hypothetical protein
MYKKIIIIACFFVSTLSACEFVNGVIINDKNVSSLFETVRAVHASNQEVSNEVEALYIQYLCLIAQYGERYARSSGGERIIQQLERFISPVPNSLSAAFSEKQ